MDRLDFRFAGMASVVVLAACLFGVGCNDDSSDSSNDEPAVEAPPGIVAMGDSVTEGSEIRGDPYPLILSLRIGIDVYNEGVGGHSSFRGAGLADDVVQFYEPDYVLIMYGVIDMWHSDRSLDVIGNLEYMVTLFRQHSATPIIATIPPRYSEDPYLEELHDILNQRIRRFARDARVTLVDVGAAFEGRPELMQADGVHPNDDGTAVIADLFYNALVSLGVVEP